MDLRSLLLDHSLSPTDHPRFFFFRPRWKDHVFMAERLDYCFKVGREGDSYHFPWESRLESTESVCLYAKQTFGCLMIWCHGLVFREFLCQFLWFVRYIPPRKAIKTLTACCMSCMQATGRNFQFVELRFVQPWVLLTIFECFVFDILTPQ